jgi:hypothetical protein
VHIYKLKNLQIIHLILGFFFFIAGILTLFKGNYLFSIWIISLGMLFLFYIFKEIFYSNIRPVIIDIIHYTLALVVLVTGLITLLN